jgi:hypothetical protein
MTNKWTARKVAITWMLCTLVRSHAWRSASWKGQDGGVLAGSGDELQLKVTSAAMIPPQSQTERMGEGKSSRVAWCGVVRCSMRVVSTTVQYSVYSTLSHSLRRADPWPRDTLPRCALPMRWTWRRTRAVVRGINGPVTRLWVVSINNVLYSVLDSKVILYANA